MELSRESRKWQCRGQIIKYWHQTMCLDIEDLAMQCSKWQNSNFTVRNMTVELQEEMYNIRLVLVGMKKECN